MKNQKTDTQTLEMLDVIKRYAAEDYSVTAKMYGKNDLFDALATGINMMGEELEASKREREDKTRKLIETHKALEQENYLVNTLLKNIPDHIYFKDLESKFLRVSKSFASREGFEDPDELIGKSDHDLFSGEHADKALLDEKKIIKTGKTLLDIEEKETWEDGRETWVLTSKMPFFDNTGKIIGTFGISHDITSRKLREKDVNERMKELKCLHGISEIIETRRVNPDEVYQAIVNILPSGSQYPEIICSRIILEKKSYKTDNFRKTKWMLQADIMVNSQTTGSVEIYYLEEIPGLFEGPFLEEERDLINTVARQIGEYTERKQVEAVLKQSEERFRIVFDFAPDAIYTNDMKGTFTDGNKAAENMLGYSREELIGKSFIKLNILSKTQILRALKLLAKNTLGKPTGPDEFILKRKDGRKVIAEILTYPVKMGGKIQVLGIARDITKRKQADEALKEREELLDNITSSAQDGIIMTDNGGKIVFWNRSAEKIFGYNAEEITGRNYYDILVPAEFYKAHKQGVIKFIKKGMENAIGKTVEFSAFNKNGDRFPVELSMSATRMKGQWHAIGIIRDITDRKEIEEKLKIAKLTAELANQAKSEFLANISHEIRTPMNTILGFSEILDEQLKGDPRYHDYVTGIRNSGKGLLGLINDILDLSKIEAGKLEINYEPINPYSIIEEIRQIFSIMTLEKKLEFNINVDPKLPKSLLFDETRLRQVLFNLIGNAIKFTSKGGITVNIKSEDTNKEQSHVNLEIEVIDTGIGIPEKEQKIIFEPFRQKEGQSTRRYGGTGLGLTITQRLVNIMGGTIGVMSEPGKGSTFTVHLTNIQVSAISDLNQKDEGGHMSVLFNDPLILLVEDIESNRRVVSGYLDSYNIRIIEAVNGSAGVEKAEKHKPDLILMDIQMPGMDGFEATKIIKSDKNLRDIPVIALTATTMKSDAEEIAKICDGYLRKPVTKSELVSELSKYLPHSEFKADRTESTSLRTSFLSEIEKTVSQGNGLPAAFCEYFTLEIVPQYQSLLKNRSNKGMKIFADMVSEAGDQYNLDFMEAFGSDLRKQLISFNIQKINSKLSDFQEMTDLISKYI
ncbi:MAG: PAS domain S-box protein [Bacteroidales bacterium]|nr:PAS domain S-box protein [Bacteroidales bacterium]